jgi:large conductance mechanosensitive channel protein
MPLIAAIFRIGDFSSLKALLVDKGDVEANVYLNYGQFIQSIIDFLIIAFCIFMVVKAVNKIRDAGKKEEPAEAPAPEKKSGLSTGALIGIIAGALAVIAAIVVIIIVATGKKSAPQAAQQAAPQPMPGPIPQAAPQKRAMLRSMSTQHGGQTFPVGSTPVMIGRDPSSCTIVYREGTAGVSGKHCQVQFDAGSGNFIITDLRSSYGTFLMNGTKLPANTPYQLKAGDSFYVGDKQNVIRTELG